MLLPAAIAEAQPQPPHRVQMRMPVLGRRPHGMGRPAGGRGQPLGQPLGSAADAAEAAAARAAAQAEERLARARAAAEAQRRRAEDEVEDALRQMKERLGRK